MQATDFQVNAHFNAMNIACRALLAAYQPCHLCFSYIAHTSLTEYVCPWLHVSVKARVRNMWALHRAARQWVKGLPQPRWELAVTQAA